MSLQVFALSISDTPVWMMQLLMILLILISPFLLTFHAWMAIHCAKNRLLTRLSKIAWFVVMAILPIFGAGVYYVFGRGACSSASRNQSS